MTGDRHGERFGAACMTGSGTPPRASTISATPLGSDVAAAEGVSKTYIDSRGKADVFPLGDASRPFTSSATESGRQQNRSVEIVVRPTP